MSALRLIMHRNSTILWCRLARFHNPLTQLQCCSSLDVCSRYRNTMRLVGLRMKSQTVGNLGTIPPASSLIKPAIFTVLFSGASFAGAAIWQYENMKHRARELLRSPAKWIMQKVEPGNLFRGTILQNIRTKPGQFQNFYKNLSEEQKVFIPIVVLNTAVLLAWKIPRLHAVMSRYFVSNSTSKKVCLPMVLSCFSHISILHFFLNMFVLHGFVSVVEDLGKEQFLALYLSSGVVASFASLVFRVLTKQVSASLGASGCLMGIVVYTSLRFPDSQLAFLFLPMFPFSAGSGVRFLFLIEIIGLICRFKLFDHAAHLGGAFTGLFWHAWGNEHLWQRRGPILEWWHKIRSGNN